MPIEFLLYFDVPCHYLQEKETWVFWLQVWSTCFSLALSIDASHCPLQPVSICSSLMYIVRILRRDSESFWLQAWPSCVLLTSRMILHKEVSTTEQSFLFPYQPKHHCLFSFMTPMPRDALLQCMFPSEVTSLIRLGIHTLFAGDARERQGCCSHIWPEVSLVQNFNAASEFSLFCDLLRKCLIKIIISSRSHQADQSCSPRGDVERPNHPGIWSQVSTSNWITVSDQWRACSCTWIFLFSWYKLMTVFYMCHGKSDVNCERTLTKI